MHIYYSVALGGGKGKENDGGNNIKCIHFDNVMVGTGGSHM
jgi:hypothetical protein